MIVFMMIYNPSGYNKVSPIFENVVKKVSEYIENPPYIKTIDKQLNFSIDIYDSKSAGLNGDYNDFFMYIDLKTNKEFIISANEEKIKAFCAYINRLTN